MQGFMNYVLQYYLFNGIILWEQMASFNPNQYLKVNSIHKICKNNINY